MCGIVASSPGDDAAIRFGLEQLAVRGPDGAQTAVLESATIGAVRLATTGTHAGLLPRLSDDGRIAAALDGQIYNYQEIASRLGVGPLATDSDILIPLYERYGLEFARHLRGMFAIVLVDVRRSRVVASVDHFGLKPLYWARDVAAETDHFASTIQAFPESLRRLAERVPPGMTVSTDGEYSPLYPPHADESEGTWEELLVGAMLEQVPRDLPFAVLLSGGVDSSLLTTVLCRELGAIPTYCCGVRGAPDFQYAREVARITGSDHTEVVVDEAELPSLVDEVVRATGSFEPFLVVGGMATYAAARAIHNDGFRVALSGEGADELFGGYDEFLSIPLPLLNSALNAQQHDLGATEGLRLDRCTMEWAVEARVPFLDQRVVGAVRELPARAKRRSGDGLSPVRKFALREFAARYLPAEIAWREKMGFTSGSGVRDALMSMAQQRLSSGAKLPDPFPGYLVDSPVGAWTMSAWQQAFGDTIAGSWEEMQNRGLVRQSFNKFAFVPCVDGLGLAPGRTGLPGGQT